MIKKFLTHPVITSSFLLFFASFLTNVLNFFFSILVLKLLPLNDYGEYTSIFAYIYILSLPFSIFTLIIIKKVGSRSEKERLIFTFRLEKLLFYLARRYSWLITFLVVFLGLGLFWWSNFSYWYSCLFIAFSLVLGFFTHFYSAVFQGLKWLLLVSLMSMIFSSLKLLFSYFGINWHANLAVLLTVFFILGFCQFIVSWGFFWRKKKKLRIININKHLISWSFFFQKDIFLIFFTTVGILGLVNFDLILAKKFLSPTEMSFYSLLSLFLRAVSFAFAPLISAGYIFFTSKDNQSQQKKILLLFSSFFLFAGLIISVIYMLFGRELILLVANEKYLVIKQFLPLASWGGLLYCLNWFFSQYFLAKSSILSLMVFLAIIFQIAILYFFHQSFDELFYWNFMVHLTTFIIYLLAFVNLLGRKFHFEFKV